MEKFKEIIDNYISNYLNLNQEKIEYKCDYGELIFYKENSKNSQILVLHGIYIFPEHRNKGFCREILQYLIDKCDAKFQYFCVQSVISKILYNYLLRFEYKNKKFKNTKIGFVYNI